MMILDHNFILLMLWVLDISFGRQYKNLLEDIPSMILVMLNHLKLFFFVKCLGVGDNLKWAMP